VSIFILLTQCTWKSIDPTAVSVVHIPDSDAMMVLEINVYIL